MQGLHKVLGFRGLGGLGFRGLDVRSHLDVAC